MNRQYASLSRQHPNTNLLTNDRAQAHKEAFIHLEQSLSTMRPFGRDADALFQELDALRRDQVQLALQHLAVDEGLHEHPHGPAGSEVDFTKRDVENTAKFTKREIDINNLMSKLDMLSQNLMDFHEKLAVMDSSISISPPPETTTFNSTALSPPLQHSVRPYGVATTTLSASSGGGGNADGMTSMSSPSAPQAPSKDSTATTTASPARSGIGAQNHAYVSALSGSTVRTDHDDEGQNDAGRRRRYTDDNQASTP
ncbi:hypothetical protein SeMB42_g03251 [Synchytrium endobioticum]|uniref:Uncharacterized protein n=1 Tax=Synchytrium endobioticum TaxID=286115 RepID=A0A507CX22_9FUNG|nr:hypothetical protein SeLEV6574_g04914 [Synchytrium endobioticum]TPX47684.1 hypothetical protein SeMB42_g03251 [Synchytrium endobioticum]